MTYFSMNPGEPGPYGAINSRPGGGQSGGNGVPPPPAWLGGNDGVTNPFDNVGRPYEPPIGGNSQPASTGYGGATYNLGGYWETPAPVSEKDQWLSLYNVPYDNQPMGSGSGGLPMNPLTGQYDYFGGVDAGNRMMQEQNKIKNAFNYGMNNGMSHNDWVAAGAPPLGQGPVDDGTSAYDVINGVDFSGLIDAISGLTPGESGAGAGWQGIVRDGEQRRHPFWERMGFEQWEPRVNRGDWTPRYGLPFGNEVA